MLRVRAHSHHLNVDLYIAVLPHFMVHVGKPGLTCTGIRMVDRLSTSTWCDTRVPVRDALLQFPFLDEMLAVLRRIPVYLLRYHYYFQCRTEGARICAPNPTVLVTVTLLPPCRRTTGVTGWWDRRWAARAREMDNTGGSLMTATSARSTDAPLLLGPSAEGSEPMQARNFWDA